MNLVIVESPTKAKTISKFLGKNYNVKSSYGHVRDLPKSNKAAIDIPAGFVPHYEISKGKEKVVHELTTLASKASEIQYARQFSSYLRSDTWKWRSLSPAAQE